VARPDSMCQQNGSIAKTPIVMCSVRQVSSRSNRTTRSAIARGRRIAHLNHRNENRSVRLRAEYKDSIEKQRS
jgi:hypothetical protein